VSHLHIEFIPAAPSAGGLPHLAASELGAGAAINDVVPEQAAAELRATR
jgi:galactose-1-phosphate uridylyltransferase